MLSMKKYIFFALTLMLLLGSARADAPSNLPDWASSALKVPNGITTVEESAFEGLATAGIVLPASVTYVQAGAFAGCESIKRICIMGRDTVFGQNALGTKNEPKEIWGLQGSTAEAYAKEYGYTFVRISSDIEELLSYADSKIGTRYVSGRWDCILFVRNCYLTVLSIKIPDTTRAMENFGTSSLVASQKLKPVRITDIRQIKPGDVICWCNDEVSYCTHVGMYVGEGTVGSVHHSSGVFIEASRGAGKVRYNYISPTGAGYYTRNFICAWRILP